MCTAQKFNSSEDSNWQEGAHHVLSKIYFKQYDLIFRDKYTILLIEITNSQQRYTKSIQMKLVHPWITKYEAKYVYARCNNFYNPWIFVQHIILPI